MRRSLGRGGHSPRTTTRVEGGSTGRLRGSDAPVPGRAGALDYAKETVDLVRVQRVVDEANLVDGADPGDPGGPSAARTPPILQRPGRHGEPAIGVDDRQPPINVDSPAAFRSGWFKDGGGLFGGLLLGSMLGGLGRDWIVDEHGDDVDGTTATSATGSANDHIVGAIATICPPAPPPGNDTISCESIRRPPGRSWQRHRTPTRRRFRDGRLVGPLEKRPVDPTLVQHRPGNHLFGPRTGHRAHIAAAQPVPHGPVPARSGTHSPRRPPDETGLPRVSAG